MEDIELQPLDDNSEEIIADQGPEVSHQKDLLTSVSWSQHPINGELIIPIDLTTVESEDLLTLPTRRLSKTYLPFWIACSAYFTMFVAYNVSQNMAISLHGKNGSIALAILYICFIVGNFITPAFLAGLFRQNISLMICCGSVAYTVFMVANIPATLVTLIAGAACVGLCAGFVWVGYASLLTALARYITEQDYLAYIRTRVYQHLVERSPHEPVDLAKVEKLIEPIIEPNGRIAVSKLSENQLKIIMKSSAEVLSWLNSIGWAVLNLNTVCGGFIALGVLGEDGDSDGDDGSTTKSGRITTLFIVFVIVAIVANILYYLMYKYTPSSAFASVSAPLMIDKTKPPLKRSYSASKLQRVLSPVYSSQYNDTTMDHGDNDAIAHTTTGLPDGQYAYTYHEDEEPFSSSSSSSIDGHMTTLDGIPTPATTMKSTIKTSGMEPPQYPQQTASPKRVVIAQEAIFQTMYDDSFSSGSSSSSNSNIDGSVSLPRQSQSYRPFSQVSQPSHGQDAQEDSHEASKQSTSAKESPPNVTALLALYRSFYLMRRLVPSRYILLSLLTYLHTSIPTNFVFAVFTANSVKPVLGTPAVSLIIIVVASCNVVGALIGSRVMKTFNDARWAAMIGTSVQITYFIVILAFPYTQWKSKAIGWVVSIIIACAAGLSDSFVQSGMNSSLGMAVGDNPYIRPSAFGLCQTFKSVGSIILFVGASGVPYVALTWFILALMACSLISQAVNYYFYLPIDAEHVMGNFHHLTLGTRGSTSVSRKLSTSADAYDDEYPEESMLTAPTDVIVVNDHERSSFTMSADDSHPYNLPQHNDNLYSSGYDNGPSFEDDYEHGYHLQQSPGHYYRPSTLPSSVSQPTLQGVSPHTAIDMQVTPLGDDSRTPIFESPHNTMNIVLSAS